MAASSLLALIDDITTILDDVAVLTKVATKKTAGVLGDDLALNAQQVTGVKASRELPVVWAVAKGSLVNKAILVPAALLISALAPWAITPLLMLGGLFLCYEGFEKVAHKLFHGDEAENAAHHAELTRALVLDEDLVKVEREKIKGAIRTDFILSAEIVVIALSTVADRSFGTRVAVLTSIALLMTIGVYGLVAAIVKLDDAGNYLNSLEGQGGKARLGRPLGAAILLAAPWLMRLLSVAGTAAVFLVGGGILAHGIPPLHHWVDSLAAGGGLAGGLAGIAANGLVGVVAGALALGLVSLAGRLRRGFAGADTPPPTGGDANDPAA
jgi:hypothetical protein